MVGEGRLADVMEIADAVFATERVRGCRDLAGETILITAGGTREPIDPVRYVGNRSSGKMGFALADAALARGAEVIMISAATDGTHDVACERILVGTASEMQEAVLAKLPRVSVVLMAAAVADYGVAQPATQKIKKRGDMMLELTQNEDILRQVVRQRKPETLVVGFAAETENVVEEGRRKLREKGVDAMVANDVSQADRGFGVDRNAGVFLTRTEEVELPFESKREMAERILDGVVMMRAAMVVTA
jgi:phosphopantothenoylcysteine decarboxylase/phosphopantothenate--cysteine ligase